MPSTIIHKHQELNRAIEWADRSTTKALYDGPVVWTLSREIRTAEQNNKSWPMYRCFEPVLFNGQLWKDKHWKNFLLSAFNDEIPAVGFNGEPVPMNLSTSNMSKRRFSEFIEFVYAAGAERDVSWSDPAIKFYEETCGI